MAMSNPREEARRAHNKKVRDNRKEYKQEVKSTTQSVKGLRDTQTQVPYKILTIIEDIIETQNKGVPLSDFQKHTVEELFKSFKLTQSDELKKPRLVEQENGMVIKDMRVLTPDGETNFTDIKAPDTYKNQTIETLLPLGDTTYNLIDMISETLSENAKLIEQIRKQEKEHEKSEASNYSEEETKDKDKFQTQIIGLEKINNETNSKASKEISNILNDVLNSYNASRDTTLTPLTDGESHWIANVPILNHGDQENINPNAETIDALTARKQMIKVDLPNDVQLAQMLPKNITEQLIEVLSRAVKENSELHNQIYTADKIQRKFPTKLTALLISLALAAGVAHGVSNLNYNSVNAQDLQETNTVDVVNPQEEAVVQFNPSNLQYYINWAEDYLYQLKSYNNAIQNSNTATDIYQKSAESTQRSLELNQIQNYLGENYKDLTYSEMIEGLENVLAELKSDDTTAFIESLIQKSNKAKTSGNTTKTEGTLSEFNLTPEEYSNYQELESYVVHLQRASSQLENAILENPDFRKILNNEDVKLTEKDIEKILTAGGVGMLAGAATSAGVTAGLYLILKNARKKEQLRELERQNEKQDNMEV